MNDQKKRFNAKKENQFANRSSGVLLTILEIVGFSALAYGFMAVCCSM